MSKNSENIPIFVTNEQDCPYFKDQHSITAFVDPKFNLSDYYYMKLSELGFRRSGEHLYRPACNTCQKCIATRLDVHKFILKRRFKRILKKNEDLSVQQVSDIDTRECYQLYEQYIHSRHREGSMYPPSKEQFRQFLFCRWNKTQYFEFRLEGKLIAVAVTDEFPTSLSAVYTFFSPEYPQRSLGIFAILTQLNQTRLQQKQYLYLGYWIKELTTMNYKGQFRPIECFIEGNWQELE